MAKFIKFKNDTAGTFHVVNAEEISNFRADWNPTNDTFELNIFFNNYQAIDNVMRIRFNGDLETDALNSERLIRDNNRFIRALSRAVSKAYDRGIQEVVFEAEVQGVSLV